MMGRHALHDGPLCEPLWRLVDACTPRQERADRLSRKEGRAPPPVQGGEFPRQNSMTTATRRFTEETVEVAQTRLYLLKGGTGKPLLVLHGVEGHEGWLAFHDALADHATVYAPSHPGYGHSECPSWLGSIPHQAVFYHWFLGQGQLINDERYGVEERFHYADVTDAVLQRALPLSKSLYKYIRVIAVK